MHVRDDELEKLSAKLGYHFSELSLLRQALTHPSASLKDHNQRLEFLGDAVVELCVSEWLYTQFPNLQEGELTKQRARLVCEASLARLAKSLHLGELLQMNQSAVGQGGRDNPAMLADALEALLAAVFLDGGFESAKQVISTLWALISLEEAPSNAENECKNRLQEWLQQHSRSLPEYRVVDEQGEVHERVFTIALYLDGLEVARASGKTKKKAEQTAAAQALQDLKQREDTK